MHTHWEPCPGSAKAAGRRRGAPAGPGVPLLPGSLPPRLPSQHERHHPPRGRCTCRFRTLKLQVSPAQQETGVWKTPPRGTWQSPAHGSPLPTLSRLWRCHTSSALGPGPRGVRGGRPTPRAPAPPQRQPALRVRRRTRTPTTEYHSATETRETSPFTTTWTHPESLVQGAGGV